MNVLILSTKSEKHPMKCILLAYSGSLELASTKKTLDRLIQQLCQNFFIAHENFGPVFPEGVQAFLKNSFRHINKLSSLTLG